MRHGSLFSGIGGFDLAAQWMGWQNVFHCEINPFCQQILKYYWPEAASHEDITQTDFTIHRGRIDVLSGGFPCQPFSLAGKRKGTEDSRHLWPQMLRAIREIAPKYVVGENVFGLINWDAGLVFEQVCSDLESAGYEVAAVVIPAAAVNAPHGRDRVFFIAYRDSNGQHERNSEHEINASEGRINALGDFGTGGEYGLTADTGNSKRKGRKQHRSIEKTWKVETGSGQFSRPVRTDWTQFPTQSPICGGDDGLPAELDGITFSKWRNESIKGYGNAVVPQIPYRIFSTIQNIENDNPSTHSTGR